MLAQKDTHMRARAQKVFKEHCMPKQITSDSATLLQLPFLGECDPKFWLGIQQYTNKIQIEDEIQGKRREGAFAGGGRVGVS